MIDKEKATHLFCKKCNRVFLKDPTVAIQIDDKYLGKVWLCPKCLSNLEAGIFCEWCERFVNIDEAFETDNELTLCANCEEVFNIER